MSGKDCSRIRLEFVLIDEVWVHHFQKSGSVDELQKLGFRRIDLGDGYDKSWYWNL